MRILVAQTTWASMALAKDLKSAGHLVTAAHDGDMLIDFAVVGTQNAIVFDLDLPDRNGLQTLAELRRLAPNTPIVVLTAKWDRDLVVDAFSNGADDVIAGMLPGPEAAARLLAIARRASGLALPEIEIGALMLDCASHTARFDGWNLNLTRMEYEVLEFIALRAGHIVSKDALMTQLYALHNEPDMRVLDVFICHIRQKLQQAGADPALIETAWGQGTRLVPEASAAVLALAA